MSLLQVIAAAAASADDEDDVEPAAESEACPGSSLHLYRCADVTQNTTASCATVTYARASLILMVTVINLRMQAAPDDASRKPDELAEKTASQQAEPALLAEVMHPACHDTCFSPAAALMLNMHTAGHWQPFMCAYCQ